MTGRAPTPGDMIVAVLDADAVQAAAELAATVPAVDPEMTRKLRRCGAAVEKAVLERNAALVEAHAAGHSLRSIAAAVGITHVGVMKIVRNAVSAEDGA